MGNNKFNIRSDEQREGGSNAKMENAMKVLAMYLPQFHRVKENDEWWGEGFTDWVTARQAFPRFEGHYQPHIPQNEYYYNLLEKESMEHQAELMKKYGVDGLCMYHYWFKDGKQILEKPVENLLHWKDVDMPYCLYWANETWARSWSGLQSGNVWVDNGDALQNTGNRILLEQAYGDKRCWEEHFKYLLPFFQDERYIKKDGKPVFVIYRTMEIPCLHDMLCYWKELAVEAGLKGLYIIGARCNTRVTSQVDAWLIHEPAAHMTRNETVEIKKIDYNDIWEKILSEPLPNKTTYFGGFVGYDDTPRRGERGTVIINNTPKEFGCFLTELMAKNAAAGSDIVFLNAWNEWGEGMHLEPDEQYGTSYLECISDAKKKYVNSIPRYQELHRTVGEKTLYSIRKQRDKFEDYLNLLDVWMTLREKGIHVNEYLTEHGYEKILIYGYGILGRHLLWELELDEADVVGVVDQMKINLDKKTYQPTDKLPEFDLMIVTSYYYLEEIRTMFEDKSHNLMSIETILKEMEKNG